jgi:hypothetical protein
VVVFPLSFLVLAYLLLLLLYLSPPSMMILLLYVDSILIDLLLPPFDKVYLTKVDILSILSLPLHSIVLSSTISMMVVATKNLYYSILEMPYLVLLS